MSASALETLFASLEAKRPSVAAHSGRVATYAVRLAAHYGLSGDMVETIRVGGLLHDIGKLLVPRKILRKVGSLKEHDWLQLRSHPDMGVELLEHADVRREVRDIVLHHHERYDGHGYPDAMSGRSIPWSVRIVSVVDAFDALTSPREYRNALSVAGARAQIAREAGTRFCPWVVSGLLSLPSCQLEPSSLDIWPSYLPEGLPAPDSLNATEAWTV
jgi:putative nucleotidyltransferase with HDIG domain